MTPHEEILEAITHAEEEDTDWWEYFQSIKDAQKAIKRIKNYSPEEYEVIQLADIMNEEFPYSEEDLNVVYNKCINILAKQLRKN